MAGVFDHLHIKRNTAGSSNELSFDVLDAARSGLDAKDRRHARLPHLSRAPKVPTTQSSSQGSFHSIAKTTKAPQQEEVERRKKARRAHRRRLRVLGATVMLAVLFGLLWFGYRNYLEVQDFNTRFTAIVNQFAEEDEFLAELDGLMEAMSRSDQAQERTQALAQIPDARESLSRTFDNARAARSLAVSGEDETALDQVMATAEARIDMLGSAQTALVLVVQRDEQAQKACAIWNSVVKAAQDAKEASSAANAASTEEDTTKARGQTQAALDDLQSAGKGLRSLGEADARIDLSAQVSYVDKRISSLQAALATADALLEGDRELAKAKNDEYNAADKEAAALAGELPLSPEETVARAYAPDIEAAATSYSKARQTVVATDSLIREYLDSHASASVL